MFSKIHKLSGNQSSSNTTNMKARIKRQDVEHFRNTEKINCHIKYSEMKDTGLSFDLFFFHPYWQFEDWNYLLVLALVVNNVIWKGKMVTDL